MALRKVPIDKVPPGLQVTESGYLRITRAGRHKWKLLHRRVMEQLLEQTHPLTLAVLGIQLDSRGQLRNLDDKWDAHHIDFCKTHNCACNLMLLEHAVHGAAFINRTTT